MSIDEKALAAQIILGLAVALKGIGEITYLMKENRPQEERTNQWKRYNSASKKLQELVAELTEGLEEVA